MSLLLGLGTAAALELPPTAFGWKLPASASLQVFHGKDAEFERDDPYQTDQLADCLFPEQTPVRDSAPIPKTPYKMEWLLCKDKEPSPVGSDAPLMIRIARNDGRGSWSLALASGIIQLGFERLPEDWAAVDGASDLSPQPFIGSIGVPGIVVVQFVTHPVFTRGGSVWGGEQHLFDLRGAEPKHLAAGVWSRVSDAFCREEGADGSGYRCDWEKGRSDFVCVDTRATKQRTFTLLTGRPLPQTLSKATTPLETAVPGRLVYVPQIGLARFVARISPTQVIVTTAKSYLVAKGPAGWRATDPEKDQEFFESTDEAPASIRELRGWGPDRAFDVVLHGAQKLIRYQPGPQPAVSEVVVASVDPDLGGACQGRIASEIIWTDVLRVQPTAKGPSVEFQPHFESDSLVGSDHAEANRRCPVTVSFDEWSKLRDPQSVEPLPCDRPMVPLISLIRPGSPDLLWADAQGSEMEIAFSLRGRGKGTVLLLDGGMSDDQWKRIALGLSHGNELEVVRVVASADEVANVRLIRNSLMGVSAKAWSLVTLHARRPPKPANSRDRWKEPVSVGAIGALGPSTVTDLEVDQVCGAIVESAAAQGWISAPRQIGKTGKHC